MTALALPGSDLLALRDTLEPTGGTLHSACGLQWDTKDVLRFLSKVVADPDSECQLWTGARSRGLGNRAWYGTFKVKGKAVRAHKFAAVAIFGLRPVSMEDHVDHECQNSLCLRHLQCTTAAENLALRWSRLYPDFGEPYDDDCSDIAHWENDYLARRFSGRY